MGTFLPLALIFGAIVKLHLYLSIQIWLPLLGAAGAAAMVAPWPWP
jgi:hypothetical protein